MRRLVYMIAVAAAVLGACCTPAFGTSSEARARTSLDVLADVVDPAYQLAMRGCVDSEKRVLAGVDLDAATPEQAGQALGALNAISRRCHQVREGFDKIRGYHDQAVAFVEDGRFDEALDQLDDMRRAWRALTERLSDENG